MWNWYLLTIYYTDYTCNLVKLKKNAGKHDKPVLDREGRKCLQRRREWRHASQVASTTESLHKMWCEIGKETFY